MMGCKSSVYTLWKVGDYQIEAFFKDKIQYIIKGSSVRSTHKLFDPNVSWCDLTWLSTIFSMIPCIFTLRHNLAPVEVGYHGADMREYYNTTLKQVKQITHLLT